MRRFYPRYYLRWLVGTKHLPESKNTSQNPKTLHRIQKHFTESKTLPRIQNVLDSGTCFWILGSVLDSGPCFWILGRVFGFWKVFLDSGKCFWILGSVLDSRECFVPTSHRNYLFVLQRFWFSWVQFYTNSWFLFSSLLVHLVFLHHTRETNRASRHEVLNITCQC